MSTRRRKLDDDKNSSENQSTAMNKDEKHSLIDNSPTESTPSKSSKMKHIQKAESPWNLLLCFLGIFVSYLIFGILQEKITRGQYEGGDKFTFIQVLVFIQCCVNAVMAKMVLVMKRGTARDFAKDHTPAFLYASAAASYMGAMLASNNALKFIPYPTQVIGKSCKPIAVMILGILWAGKRYTKTKIICVLIIVIGVALFMYNPEKGGPGQINFGYGEMLLLVSLTLDGFTGAFQEKMRTDEYKTTEHNMMYNMNLWSCGILLVIILAAGEHTAFLAFASKHPSVWLSILVFSLCSAVGQHFIFLTVVTFGPLTCSIITTTRKFFTVLASVFLFRNPMSVQKWLATLFVFMGLGLDAKYGKKR